MWLPRVLVRPALGIAVAVGILGAVEGVLRLVGVEAPERFFYAKVGPTGQTWRVTNLDVGANWFRTGDWEECIKEPRPQWFLEEKPSDVYRVFVLGESSAYGTPLDDSATWVRQFEHLLRAGLPGKRVEVLNLAIRAISFSVYFDVMDEILSYDPDLVVLYAGHNEFYGVRNLDLVHSIRIWRLAELLLRRGTRSQATGRVGLRADWEIPAGDPQEQAVHDRFQRDLDRLVEALEGVPLLAYVPWGNERHLSPLCSKSGSRQAEADELLATVAGAPELARGSVCEGARALRAEAPHSAAADFVLGWCALDAGDVESSRSSFEDAIDHDCIPVRARNVERDLVRNLPIRHPGASIVIADPEAALRDLGGGTPFGSEVFFDHVHFTIPASFRVAMAGVRALSDAGEVGGVQVSADDLPSYEATRFALHVVPLDEYAYENRMENFLNRSSIRNAATKALNLSMLHARRAELWEAMDPASRDVVGSGAAIPHLDLLHRFAGQGNLARALREAWAQVGITPYDPEARAALANLLALNDDMAGAREQRAWAALLSDLRRPSGP